MSDMNETVAYFGRGQNIAIADENLWQYDYGQILKIQGLELPTTYTVDFCNIGDTETISMIGDENGVQIPDDLLVNGKSIYAYVWLHAGNNDGETEYKIGIPVFPRPERGDEEPTPAQQSVIDQLIIQLNNGIEHVDEIAESIDPPFVRGDGEDSAVLTNESAPNVVIGKNSIAAGSGNTVNDNNSAAFGKGNIISGRGRNYTFGEYNEANGYSMMGLAAGGRNVLGATICTALGYGLIANCDFGLVVGGYNIAQDLNDPNRKEYLVIAGNGTDSGNRSNAATLDREGNLWVSGKMTAGADPTSDMDVATKKYVDDAVARIESLLNSITIENGVLTFRRGVNE